MISATYTRHPLIFHRPAGTSRGILSRKECWYLILRIEDGVTGIGEVAFIPGLSREDPADMEIRLDHICKLISRGEMDPTQELPDHPGIQFALETAVRDLDNGGNRVLYPSAFTDGKEGIRMNGLIWMGTPASMLEQISEKISQGFQVLKLKVGALRLDEELELLSLIRGKYSSGNLEIRLDANGAWSPERARGILASFSAFDIHSIEQPIAAGQIEKLAGICRDSEIPIALDEELLTIHSAEERRQMIEHVKPPFIIVKPGLLGGFSVAKEWIQLAESAGTGWWITSALESNVGLSAIAQWTATLDVRIPQGLGTGKLYKNNIPSPLSIEGDMLWFGKEEKWDLTTITKNEF